MADGEGRAREGKGEGEEGEAFYLSRKTFTTKMGGAAGAGDGRTARCKRWLASERAALTRQLSDVSIHSNGGGGDDAASCAGRACVSTRSTRT